MDIEAKKPMRTDALFPIASMNKILTSAAALTLYQQGRFQLDEPASKYIPQLKNLRVAVSNQAVDASKRPLATVPAGREITVRDLFRHTAGFLYAFNDTPIDRLYKEAGFPKWNRPLKDFVDRLAEFPLAYQPGTRWEYSYGIDVLGYLVQVTSGRPLSEALKERIFTPLRMSDTDHYVPADKLDRFGNDYAFVDGKLKLVDVAAQSNYRSLPKGISGGGGWETGYGGVLTTASDFARFLQMILNRGQLDGVRILRPETVDLMVTNQIRDLHEKPLAGYGLGVGVEPDKDDPQKTRIIYWAGGPYCTSFWADLKCDMLGVCLMQNERSESFIGEFRALSQACVP
jgi:CubicO group peptidase (beta-lactamase class C family)